MLVIPLGKRESHVSASFCNWIEIINQLECLVAETPFNCDSYRLVSQCAERKYMPEKVKKR